MKNKIKEISKKLNSKFYFDYNTSKNVWFRAGGQVSVFCLVYNLKELLIILNEIRNFPFDIIGAGSNILVRDSGFKGILFKLGKGFNKIKHYDSLVEVGAGTLDVNLSKFAVKNSLESFEFYSGIPGTIGGAIKMNAGCFGMETKDILKEILMIDERGKLYNWSNQELKFEYRKSNLPKNSVVVSAVYNCKYGNKEEIKDKINCIKKNRENSQPIKSKTSGSTFKNPKNTYAAKLIDLSGCKGLNVGDIFVSEKHANFLINKNKGTAQQIEDLGNIIIDKVYNKFNIKLEWEIKIIG